MLHIHLQDVYDEGKSTTGFVKVHTYSSLPFLSFTSSGCSTDTISFSSVDCCRQLDG
jgi:hypothetical protein